MSRAAFLCSALRTPFGRHGRILAGIRTAAVWTIGTATLATTIGQPSLGDLIFSGLQTEDWRRVLCGCVAAVIGNAPGRACPKPWRRISGRRHPAR